MSILIRPGLMKLTDASGNDIYSTDTRPLAQVPAASLSVTVGGGSGPLASGIVFPDLDKTYAYFYGNVAYTDPFGARLLLEGCTTCGIASPQEWGPAGFPGITHTLADIDLGPAPTDSDGTVWADLLEMTVNLTQTPPATPAGGVLLFPSWPCEITQGADIDCEDGCCPVERLPGLSRQFWVEIVAGRIVLRRQQSVTGAVCQPANPTYGLPAYTGFMSHTITGNGQSIAGSGNMNLGGANQCSLVNTMNYQSSYAGTIVITPVNKQA